MSAIVQTIANFFTGLFTFFTPVIVFFVSVSTIVAFMLGALADPQGLMNQVVCSAIDFIANIFPSTPENLKIATILNSAGDSMPAVGRGVVKEIFSTLAIIFGLGLIVKIYKLLPFKAS